MPAVDLISRPSAGPVAAADLARQEEAFEHACVPPFARAAGKAGPR